jgi:hypothetical protein
MKRRFREMSEFQKKACLVICLDREPGGLGKMAARRRVWHRLPAMSAIRMSMLSDLFKGKRADG